MNATPRLVNYVPGIQGVSSGGIATVNIYQSWKRTVRDKTALQYFRSPLSRYAGTFATFNF